VHKASPRKRRLIADTFGPFSHLDFGRQTFPFDFAELGRLSGLEKPDEVFEAIARLDHPDAEGVLTMIGRHAADKKVAKAARAEYKASTRRAACRLAPSLQPGSGRRPAVRRADQRGDQRLD